MHACTDGLLSLGGLPGRWRGTVVAVKVVEHAPPCLGRSLQEQQFEQEALLASNLSHPNVIAT
jgi:hypothetical protein